MRHFLKWFVTGGAEIKRDVDAASGVRIVTAHGSKGLEAPVVFLIDTTTLPKPESVFPITPSIMPKNVAVDESVPSPWIWQAHKTTSEQVGVASDLLMKDKLEEYYRLLYVAMTRARDELYIYGYSRYNAANEKSWYSLLWDKLITIDGATVVDDDTIRIIHDK
jgi:ATP-dependent helicase/nuclease subunit A